MRRCNLFSRATAFKAPSPSASLSKDAPFFILRYVPPFPISTTFLLANTNPRGPIPPFCPLLFGFLCFTSVAGGYYYTQPSSTKDGVLPQRRSIDPFYTFPAFPVAPDDNVSIDDLIDQYETMLRKSDPALNQYVPDMFSIDELTSWAPKNDAQQENQHGVRTYILAGFDALTAARYPMMNGAVRQLASQFDCGEARYRTLAHPKEFKIDHTQGPSEQRTAMSAAIARWVYKDQIDCLSELKKDPEFTKLFDDQYGHLTPLAGKEEAALAFIKKNIGKLRLNVQRVRLDGTQSQEAIQVLNAAPALGVFDFEADAGKRTETGTQLLSEISKVFLTAQYEAVAAVAIAEARKNPTRRIPAVFTRVGGNMFGNDPAAIDSAIASAHHMIKNSKVPNIDVCLSAFFPEEVEACEKMSFLQNECVSIVTPEQAEVAETLAEAVEHAITTSLRF